MLPRYLLSCVYELVPTIGLLQAGFHANHSREYVWIAHSVVSHNTINSESGALAHSTLPPPPASSQTLGYAVAQWLGLRLQMLGVAMVAGVAFIAVLEHRFASVDPGESRELLLEASGRAL